MPTSPFPISWSSNGQARLFALITALLALASLLATPAQAHRANIFAWEESGRIHVECSFSGGKPAKNAPITVYDASDGTEITRLKTDTKGAGSFPIPDAAREGRKDLRLVLSAGEGHRGEWIITADEYLGTLPGSQTMTDASAAASETPPQAVATSMDETALKRIVDEALAKRIGPINRQLAALADPAPGVQDIIGGIGWIIGLFGIAALVKSRKS